MEIDIPENIKTFINEVVDSFVMWDLLIFASQRANAVDSPSRAAELLGRAEAEVEKPYSKLLKMGILVQEQGNGASTCKINPQSPFYETFQKFLLFNEIQENRLRILSYLLQKKVN